MAANRPLTGSSGNRANSGMGQTKSSLSSKNSRTRDSEQ